ncbi:universal stress protein [Olivibacter sitiensis]|uniref:universal stress protein n=1 Tax=Olivibacter sitiensis TaxID=376470 RepID=UPI000408B285|nr:universal stress protein [Olivibacter sitiensis]
MKTILVPTDFSSNAMAGVRMALDMASLMQAKLLFAYVKSPSYSPNIKTKDQEEDIHEDLDDQNYLSKLNKLVEDLYLESQKRPVDQSLLIIKGVRADAALLNYMEKHDDIDYIVMSTRGTGNRLDRFLGTNTGNIITKSHVPVVAVPADYNPSSLSKLLYATDFTNYKHELERIVPFVKLMHMSLEILHFLSLETMVLDLKKEDIEETIQQEYGIDLVVAFENKDVWHSLIHNLRKEIEKRSPSIVALFTNQHRNFFQKIFLSSKAEELSFHTSVPLLVFNK